MPRKDAKPVTSITNEAARIFIRDSEERATLFCKRISGFYLIKLKSGGAWRYRYMDDAGKRKTKTIKGGYPALKPAQAADAALAWLESGSDPIQEQADKREQAKSAEARAAKRKLGTFLEGDYAKHQARKRSGDHTLQLLRSNFAAWLDRDMASLSADDVEQWQEAKEAAGLAHATIKHVYSALKTLLNVAAKKKILTDNPLAKVSLEQAADNERARELAEKLEQSRRLLTDDEIERLHTGLHLFGEEIRRQRRNSRAHGKPDLPDLAEVEYPHWFIPFCYVALYTGLRPGDIFSLQWQEANINFKRITKTPEKTRHHENPARITMEMVEPLHDVLKRWHKQNGKPDAGLVFASPVTGERLTKKAHSRPWKHAKRLGGLPPGLDFYALRHHFISTLVANGVPLLTVAKLVGQKSTQMIEQHYGHLCPTSAADALQGFARSMERRPAVNA